MCMTSVAREIFFVPCRGEAAEAGQGTGDAQGMLRHNDEEKHENGIDLLTKYSHNRGQWISASEVEAESAPGTCVLWKRTA